MGMLDRRRFLLGSAALGGAALGSGLASRTARAVAKAGSRNRPRIAAIGVGNRGADVLSQLEPHDVVAVCDVDARYLSESARRFAGAAQYRDYRQLVAREDIDAVVICTPDHSHALPALLAMRRGWHVYLEKPLAPNLGEVQWLIDETRRSGVVTQMGNQHHSSRGYRRAAQLLAAGALGQIERILAWTNRPHWQQGRERPGDRPPVPEHLDWDLWLGGAADRPYHPLYHPFQWRGWQAFGTGTLGDMGTHLLDPIVTGLKLPLPRRVRAETSEKFGETFPASSVVHFEFAWPNATDTLPLTWFDGGRQPAAELTGASRLPDNGALVLGERGKMFLPELGQMPHVIPAELLRDAPPESAEQELDHVQRWLQAIAAERPADCDFAYGGHLTKICLLGNLALTEETAIDWDPSRPDADQDPTLTARLGRTYRPGWDPLNR
jgi:predicted dehydrogenase